MEISISDIIDLTAILALCMFCALLFIAWLATNHRRGNRTLVCHFWWSFLIVALLLASGYAMLIHSARKSIRETLDKQIRTFAVLAETPIPFDPSDAKEFKDYTDRFLEINRRIAGIQILRQEDDHSFSAVYSHYRDGAAGSGTESGSSEHATWSPESDVLAAAAKTTPTLFLDDKRFQEPSWPVQSGQFHTIVMKLNRAKAAKPEVLLFSVDAEQGNRTVFRLKILFLCITAVTVAMFFGITLLLSLFRKSNEEMELYAKELNYTNQSLKEAKKAAENASLARSHFLANMSHEIRTPLNAIVGFAGVIGRLALQRCLPEERKRCEESTNLITQSGNDLLTIINDILDFTKIDAQQIEIEAIPVSPQRIADDLPSILQPRLEAKPEVEFVVERQTAVPEFIVGDPTRLRQILVNLIGNSLKFTERGSVRLEYGTEFSEKLLFSGTPGGGGHGVDRRTYSPGDVIGEPNVLYFVVKDTGIGMTPVQLSRLFQPFVQADATLTRRFGGTGLGLSISKRLAVLLGGDITVQSEPEKGSVFRVTLPIRKPTETEMRQITEHSEPGSASSVILLSDYGEKPLTGLRVLVIEDGKVNQIVIRSQLGEAGAEVVTAENGKEGIDVIEREEAAGTGFDVVLMDMQMPVMDGYEATPILRQRNYRKPIIAITAHALSGDCEKTLEIGCDDYLSKPLDHRRLIETILKHTRRKKGRKNKDEKTK